MSVSQDDDEILIREHTQSQQSAVFAPLPSQWSEAPPDESQENPLLDRSSRRIRRQQQSMFSNNNNNAFFSPGEEPGENEFASLEALLASQNSEENHDDDDKNRTIDSPGVHDTTEVGLKKYKGVESASSLANSPIPGNMDSCSDQVSPSILQDEKRGEKPAESESPDTLSRYSPLQKTLQKRSRDSDAFSLRMSPPAAKTRSDARQSTIEIEMDASRQAVTTDNSKNSTTTELDARTRAMTPAPARQGRRNVSDRNTASMVPSFLNPSNATSILDKSRKFVQSQGRKAKKSSSAAFKAEPKTVSVSNPKAIVGTRPTHWGTMANTVRPLTNLRRPHRLGKRKLDASSVLSRKLKTPVSFLGDTPRPPNTKRRHSYTPGSVATTQKSTPVSDDPIVEDAEEPTPPPPVSFAPSFIPPPSSISPAAPENPAQDAVQGFPSAPWSPGVGSPPLRRSGGSTTGRLSKRLANIRQSIQGDRVRFQSGQYPFETTSLSDANNPRNRAKSHLDVTLLSTTGLEREKVTVLGYIHSTQQLAWICFGNDTAREQRIGRGTALRIYNGIVVPLTIALVDSDPVASRVQWMVLCTELCEAYHSSLPKLDDIPTILAKVATGLTVSSTS